MLSGKLLYVDWIGLPERLVFVRPGIVNVTPPEVYCLKLRSRATRSDDLSALDNAISMASLAESCFRDKLLLGGIESINEMTWFTSQTKEYLGVGGLELKLLA